MAVSLQLSGNTADVLLAWNKWKLIVDSFAVLFFYEDAFFFLHISWSVSTVYPDRTN